jgi:acetolactate synthase I/II/III large subunit
MKPSQLTVAAAILDELLPSGEGPVFGIPGGAAGPLFDALLDRPGLRLVVPKHEAQAVFMAMGYAHATGQPGIVLTTAGPGITNALTGLASAFADGVPVVVVSGEVPSASFGRGAVQEGSAHSADMVAIVRHVTKFATQVLIPGTAAAVGRRARATVLSGRRGPAFISLPLDVANQRISRTLIAGRVSSRFEVDNDACLLAVKTLKAAKRPVMLVGSGVRPGAGRRAVRGLAEKLNLPVMVTTKGKGVFPEDHPLFLGIFGFGGHESVIRYLQDEPPDVLLVCGSSMNDFATNSWSPLLIPRVCQIQVDIDALQIGKNYQTDIGLLGPIDVVLPHMLEFVGGVVPRRPLPAPAMAPTRPAPGRDGRLSGQQVVASLSELCCPGSVVTCDVGEFLAPAVNFLRVRDGGDFLVSLGFGSMGSSIGSAIGYKLGAPAKNVVALCGDGSYLMHGNEILTAVEQNAAITLCVVNDGRLNMVVHGQRTVYGRSQDFNHTVVDIASAARALGAEAFVVENEADLTAALAAQVRRPRVLDIRIDPDVVLEGSQRLAGLRHFRPDMTAQGDQQVQTEPLQRLEKP